MDESRQRRLDAAEPRRGRSGMAFRCLAVRSATGRQVGL